MYNGLARQVIIMNETFNCEYISFYYVDKHTDVPNDLQ